MSNEFSLDSVNFVIFIMLLFDSMRTVKNFRYIGSADLCSNSFKKDDSNNTENVNIHTLFFQHDYD